MAGTGQGAVTDSNGFTCSTASGTSCTHNYATGQPVQLTAAGAPGNDFTSWAGCDSVVGNQCNTTMNADHQVTATFTRTRHNLTVAVDLAGTGSGTITTADGIDCGVPSSGHSVCVKQYADGAHALMTAHPVDNATVSWSGECTPTGNTCDATIGPDKSVTATFTKNSSVADGGSGIASGGTGGSLGAGSLGTGAQSAPPAGSATNSGSSSQTSSAAGSFTTGIATQCTVPSGCSVGASATTTVPTGSAASKGKKKTTAVMLGSTKLHLTNGQRALVKIKLSQRGLRILKRLGHLKVRVTVNIRSGGSRSVVINRTITLKAPKKKH
jgi:hypothetical protein